MTDPAAKTIDAAERVVAVCAALVLPRHVLPDRVAQAPRSFRNALRVRLR